MYRFTNLRAVKVAFFLVFLLPPVGYGQEVCAVRIDAKEWYRKISDQASPFLLGEPKDKSSSTFSIKNKMWNVLNCIDEAVLDLPCLILTQYMGSEGSSYLVNTTSLQLHPLLYS